MDDARGGQFRSVPATQKRLGTPTMTQPVIITVCLLNTFIGRHLPIGAQTVPVRGESIEDEWVYNERNELLTTIHATDILQNSQFNLPHLETHLPGWHICWIHIIGCYDSPIVFIFNLHLYFYKVCLRL